VPQITLGLAQLATFHTSNAKVCAALLPSVAFPVNFSFLFIGTCVALHRLILAPMATSPIEDKGERS